MEAANVGLTVLTRGEFSLILATLALAAGLDQRIGTFTAGYILTLAVVGPLAVSRSETLARFLPARLLPQRVERPETRTPMVMDVGPGALDQLDTDLLQIDVVSGSRLHGLYVAELRLPTGTTLGLLARDGRTEAAGPETRLRVGDALVVFTPQDSGRRPKTAFAPSTAAGGWRAGAATTGNRVNGPDDAVEGRGTPWSVAVYGVTSAGIGHPSRTTPEVRTWDFPARPASLASPREPRCTPRPPAWVSPRARRPWPAR